MEQYRVVLLHKHQWTRRMKIKKKNHFHISKNRILKPRLQYSTGYKQIPNYVIPVKYMENKGPLTSTLQHTHFVKLCYHAL